MTLDELYEWGNAVRARTEQLLDQRQSMLQSTQQIDAVNQKIRETALPDVTVAHWLEKRRVLAKEIERSKRAKDVARELRAKERGGQ